MGKKSRFDGFSQEEIEVIRFALYFLKKEDSDFADEDENDEVYGTRAREYRLVSALWEEASSASWRAE